MDYGLKLLSLLLIGLGSIACTQQMPAEPNCRVNASYASSHQGAGACVIRQGNKLLVTQLQSGLYELPSAKSNSTNQEMRKSAQCLAHHAMWQSTGFNVEVQQVIGSQKDGTWLFECTLNAGFDGSEAPFSPPSWSKPAVKYIAFVDPFDIELQNWAQPDHFTVVRDAFVLQGINQESP
jgi:hypothetical protein